MLRIVKRTDSVSLDPNILINATVGTPSQPVVLPFLVFLETARWLVRVIVPRCVVDQALSLCTQNAPAQTAVRMLLSEAVLHPAQDLVLDLAQGLAQELVQVRALLRLDLGDLLGDLQVDRHPTTAQSLLRTSLRQRLCLALVQDQDRVPAQTLARVKARAQAQETDPIRVLARVLGLALAQIPAQVAPAHGLHRPLQQLRQQEPLNRLLKGLRRRRRARLQYPHPPAPRVAQQLLQPPSHQAGLTLAATLILSFHAPYRSGVTSTART